MENNLLKLLEKIKPIKNTTREVMSLIRKQGIFTGSTTWNVANTNSDIDIILPPKCGINFDEVIQFHNGIYLHEDKNNNIVHYFQKDLESCYVIYNDKIYNLLFMHNEILYKKWVYATEQMNLRINENPSIKEKIKNKKIRVDLFEKFKEEFDILNKS